MSHHHRSGSGRRARTRAERRHLTARVARRRRRRLISRLPATVWIPPRAAAQLLASSRAPAGAAQCGDSLIVRIDWPRYLAAPAGRIATDPLYRAAFGPGAEHWSRAVYQRAREGGGTLAYAYHRCRCDWCMGPLYSRARSKRAARAEILGALRPR